MSLLHSPESKGLAAALGLLIAIIGGVALYRPIRGMVGSVFGFQVPAHGGVDRCRVRLGGTRGSVLARCGPPCASGGVPKGECAGDAAKGHGLLSFCAWSCDLHRDVWVCFGGGVVVDVGSGLPVVHSGECSWTSR